MYEEYFSLSAPPFRLNPDPKFFFGSRSHNKAMAYLHYGLKQAEGFIVITGPVGAGKTMLISHLLDQLNRSNIIAAQLLTSNVGPDELLGHVLSAFRIEPECEGRTGQLEAFEDYLFDQLNRGRRVLLIMDEAQNLPHKTLEELRMLSNIDYDGTPLFQVFLVGQPEFRETMAAPNMEQLKQRVIASYHLENLSEEETREYILHRLSVSGWKDDPRFTSGAIKMIFEESGGRPRRINTVCNRLMLYCSLEKCHEITPKIAKTVIAEMHEEKLGADEIKTDDASVELAQADSPEPDKAKNVSLPPVRSVEPVKAEIDTYTEELTETTAQNDVAAKAGPGAVKADEADNTEAIAAAGEEHAPLRPIGEEHSEPALTASEQKGSEMDEQLQPADARPAESMSVLDRLRAKRASRHSAADGDDAPHGATLDDVATAIAAAAVNGNADVDDNFEASSVAAVADEAAPPPASEQPAEWRKSVVKSINDTRDELKQAHSSVQRLRHSLLDMQKRRGERSAQIAASLDRAESLLAGIRDAWR